MDQRSDPKPKSKIARKLAKLPPPPFGGTGVSPVSSANVKARTAGTAVPLPREPDGLLYAHDEQKAMDFADAPDVARIEAQPFLKWAGGKAQLLQQFDKFFPASVAEATSARRRPDHIDRYFEPFLGGGAVFFHLKRCFPPAGRSPTAGEGPHMVAHLRDNNAELINCYKVVRDYPEELMKALDQHLRAFNADRERYYYLVRSQHHPPPHLNPLPRRGEETKARSPLPLAGEGQGEGAAVVIERAARMIFLNKTCFNGLWRVNARGEFNIPIGSPRSERGEHKNPALYDRDPESLRE